MTGEIKDISIDYLTNKPQIILSLNERESLLNLEKLKGNKLSIEIKNGEKREV